MIFVHDVSSIAGDFKRRLNCSLAAIWNACDPYCETCTRSNSGRAKISSSYATVIVARASRPPPLPRVNFCRGRCRRQRVKRASVFMQSSYKKRTFLEYNATTPRINRAANRSAYERIKEHHPSSLGARSGGERRRQRPRVSKTQNRSSRTSGDGGSMIVRHVSLIEILCVLFLVIRSALSG